MNARLDVVRTGNISEAALLAIVESTLPVIVRSLEEVRFVELAADSLIVHNARG